MSIRYNNFLIDRFDEADNGVLTVTAFARVPGVLTYQKPGGQLWREFVSPEFLRRFDSEGYPAARRLAGIPVTNGHPPSLIRGDAEKEALYKVGETTPRVKVYHDGRVQVEFEVFDSQAIEDVRTGRKPAVSLGYSCGAERKDGVWNGIRFDAEQSEPFSEDHLALCEVPRARGATIVKFDSQEVDDSDIAWQVDASTAENFTTDKDDSMTTTYTVTVEGRPINLDSADDAQAINQLIAKLDAKGKKMPFDPEADPDAEPDDDDPDMMPAKKMKKKMDELEADAAAKQARIDSLESELQIANSLIKQDSDDAEPETKLDADEVNRLVQERFDSVLTAYNDAIESNLLKADEIKLDGTSTEISIKRAAVLKYAPEMKLDNDAQVEGAYRGLKQFGNTRRDSTSDRPAVVRVDGMGGNTAPPQPFVRKRLAYHK